MSMSNLAIVFGPTLFGLHTSANGQGGVMSDTTFQNMVRAFSLIVVSWCYSCVRRLNCQAIETILNRYTDIFIDESE